MKLIAYTRVSTVRQAEEGHGLDAQREAIHEWAAQHQHEIVREESDEGRSGTLAPGEEETETEDLGSREGLGRALRAIRPKKGQPPEADGIVVWRLDRLARDLILQEQLIAEVWRHGALYSTVAAESSVLRDDPDDPTRKLIRRILGAVAEFERDMITLRTRNGRRIKRQRGGYGGGYVTYGLKPSQDGQTFEVDEETSPVVNRIFELAAQGDSPSRIARTLDVPPPRSGEAWSRQAVTGILRNERYVGTIVSRRRFNQAQRTLEQRSRKP